MMSEQSSMPNRNNSDSSVCIDDFSTIYADTPLPEVVGVPKPSSATLSERDTKNEMDIDEEPKIRDDTLPDSKHFDADFRDIFKKLSLDKETWATLKNRIQGLLTLEATQQQSSIDVHEKDSSQDQPFSVTPYHYRIDSDIEIKKKVLKRPSGDPIAWVEKIIAPKTVSNMQSAIIDGRDVFGIKIEDGLSGQSNSKAHFYSAICQPNVMKGYQDSLAHFMQSLKESPSSDNGLDGEATGVNPANTPTNHVIVFGQSLFNLQNKKSKSPSSTNSMKKQLSNVPKHETHYACANAQSNLSVGKGEALKLLTDLKALVTEVANHVNITPPSYGLTGAVDNESELYKALNNLDDTVNERDQIARFFAAYMAFNKTNDPLNRLVLAITCFYYANALDLKNKRDLHLLTPDTGSGYRHYRKVMDSVSLAIHRFSRVKYGDNGLESFQYVINEQIASKGKAERGHAIETLGQIKFPRHLPERYAMRVVFLCLLSTALFFSSHLAVPAIVAIAVVGLGVYCLFELMASHFWNQIDATKYDYCQAKQDYLAIDSQLTTSDYVVNCDQRFKLLWQFAADDTKEEETTDDSGLTLDT